MATCKFCGRWSGLFEDEHTLCALMAANGKTLEEIRESVGAPPVSEPKPLGVSSIFWAVFGALWAFGITAGIVAAIFRALLK